MFSFSWRTFWFIVSIAPLVLQLCAMINLFVDHNMLDYTLLFPLGLLGCFCFIVVDESSELRILAGLIGAYYIWQISVLGAPHFVEEWLDTLLGTG